MPFLTRAGGRGILAAVAWLSGEEREGIKTMLKKVLIAAVVVIAAFLVVVARQPSVFKISRTASIAASPAKVFAQVNDFHRWADWSPWEKMDPDMKKTFEGPSAGPGAISSWSGNRKVGEGKMTLTQSKAPELIQIQTDFLRPMKATHQAEFTFKPEGRGTQVTWSMSGTRNFVSKAFCLFMDMDKMVGGDFEKGLAALKSVAETSPQK